MSYPTPPVLVRRAFIFFSFLAYSSSSSAELGTPIVLHLFARIVGRRRARESAYLAQTTIECIRFIIHIVCKCVHKNYFRYFILLFLGTTFAASFAPARSRPKRLLARQICKLNSTFFAASFLLQYFVFSSAPVFLCNRLMGTRNKVTLNGDCIIIENTGTENRGVCDGTGSTSAAETDFLGKLFIAKSIVSRIAWRLSLCHVLTVRHFALKSNQPQKCLPFFRFDK